MKKGEQTRELILQCAEKAFSEKGYYETQVTDIIKLARIAKGTVYLYFKSKEEILLTLLEKYATQWEAETKLDLKDFIGPEPGIVYAREYVKQRIHKTALFFGENKERCHLILRTGPGLNQVFESIIQMFEEKILNILIDDIKLGQRQGHIPEEINVEIASNAILGAVLRLSYYYFVLRKNSFQELELNGFIDKMVNVTLNSLRMNQ